MPPCAINYCFYIIEKVFDIGKDQLEFFEGVGVKPNTRSINETPKKPAEIFNAKGLNIPE